MPGSLPAFPEPCPEPSPPPATPGPSETDEGVVGVVGVSGVVLTVSSAGKTNATEFVAVAPCFFEVKSSCDDCCEIEERSVLIKCPNRRLKVTTP
jgi:hypothetical protein